MEKERLIVSTNEGLLDGRNILSFQEDHLYSQWTRDINEDQLSLQERSPL
jgi:hypothetical protein